jgi:homocysteine S-methyltransferase
MPLLLDVLPHGSLLDGAMGTELLAHGLDAAHESPESWNLERPDVVSEIHARYYGAGARAVQTNTFGANRFRLAHYGEAGEVRAYNIAAVRLALDARPHEDSFVIGSLGPTGLTPPPEGNADLLALEEAFAEQAAALAEGGVHLLHVETLYHPKEARAALRGCRLGAPDLPVIASMTCRAERSGFATLLGFSPENMLQAFVEEGADAVGANCTLAPADLLDLVRLLRTRTLLPVIARPTIAPTGAAPLLPGEFATGVRALFAVGATAVGGCCGAGPRDIAAARAVHVDVSRGYLPARSRGLG